MSHLSEYKGILFTKTLMNIKLDIVDRKKFKTTSPSKRKSSRIRSSNTDVDNYIKTSKNTN